MEWFILWFTSRASPESYLKHQNIFIIYSSWYLDLAHCAVLVYFANFSPQQIIENKEIKAQSEPAGLTGITRLTDDWRKIAQDIFLRDGSRYQHCFMINCLKYGRSCHLVNGKVSIPTCCDCDVVCSLVRYHILKYSIILARKPERRMETWRGSVVLVINYFLCKRRYLQNSQGYVLICSENLKRILALLMNL